LATHIINTAECTIVSGRIGINQRISVGLVAELEVAVKRAEGLRNDDLFFKGCNIFVKYERD
jgi:hypothetical protein